METHIITADTLYEALKKRADSLDQTIDQIYDNHDADEADMILQLAQFHEIVYC